MKISSQIAKQIRAVYFGGNWTTSNMKDQLVDVDLEMATYQAFGLNTIATLLFHTSYYITAVIEVLEGKPLTASDKFSFTHPPLLTDQDWKSMVENALYDAEKFAKLIEKLPDERLLEDFTDGKYGNYFRNLTGIIEHTHYHLGQIAVIKKILQKKLIF